MSALVPVAVGADAWIEPGSVVVLSGPPTTNSPVRRWIAAQACAEAIDAGQRALVISNEMLVEERSETLARLTTKSQRMVAGLIDFRRPAPWWHGPGPWAAEATARRLDIVGRAWRALSPSVVWVDGPSEASIDLWEQLAELVATSGRGRSPLVTTWIVTTPEVETGHAIRVHPRQRLTVDARGLFVDEHLDRDGEVVETLTTTGTGRGRLDWRVLAELEAWDGHRDLAKMFADDDGRRIVRIERG